MRMLLRRLTLSFVLLAGSTAAAGVDVYPNARLTPGLADPSLTKSKLCAKGFSTKSIRDVKESEKRKVFSRYGIAKDFGNYEVDHLISLELGGSNDVSNLWPQPYDGVQRTAREKDVVENALHRDVCAGKITLEEAQRAIATDWIAVYHKCCEGKGGKRASNAHGKTR